MPETKEKLFSRDTLSFQEAGPPRYEQLARVIEQAILNGRISPGERLPTVRQFAADLGVSPTTIASAFDLLTERGLIRPEVGRGTFVTDRPQDTPAEPALRFPRFVGSSPGRTQQIPWRRRALMTLGNSLRLGYPESLDCSTGRPDPTLLPLQALRRASATASQNVGARDLQYAGPEGIEPLALGVKALLEADSIPVRPQDLVIGSSAQQLLVLSLEIVTGLSHAEHAVIAIEEPGYQTLMDTYERAGALLVGVAVDEFGAVPASLDAALREGAKAVVLTPRAQNPTGASWSRERLAALADVLAAHPHVIVMEDDQFAGLAATGPGSLLSDPRLEERTIYIRSFSKSIAPDLRIAIAVARPQLRDLLMEAKSFADGWTSHLLQKTLAGVLADEELNGALKHARECYRERRQAAAEVVNAILAPHDGGVRCGDGLSLWIHLPPAVDAHEAVARSAASGVRMADGGAFFIRPGRSDVVRFSIGAVNTEEAAKAARAVSLSVLDCGGQRRGPIHV